MRKINKGEPIEQFTDFMRTNPSDWRTDFHNKGRFPGLSANCRSHILVFEQDCMSGYTELPIKDENRCHIDHYVKRDINPRLTFSWDNYIVDSNDDNFGARFKDSHIVAADYTNIFNPVTDHAELYFQYAEDGTIEPADNIKESNRKKAERTIELFNLNHTSLVSQRYVIIEVFNAYQDLCDDDIRACFSNSGFRSLIEYLLKNR
ncbi:MAG: retron system putative HNH endonuclease [Tannerellaceae bacterium]